VEGRKGDSVEWRHGEEAWTGGVEKMKREDER
jgi:hypothetical protein